MNLKQVVIDQKEELCEMRERPYVARTVAPDFRELLSSNLVKVITGVRRCGKSVLASQLLADRDFAYLNFDDDRLIGLNARDVLPLLIEVYGKEAKTICFDEIQNLDNWELLINRLQRSRVNLLITGSNSRLLSKELSSHLTGRHVRLELFPFSFREYLGQAPADTGQLSTGQEAVIRQKLDSYLHDGGFPEVAADGEHPRIYLKELFRSILERDILVRRRVAHQQAFKEMAMHLLANPGRVGSCSRLKNLFGLGSDHTVKNYLSYLEEAYLFFALSKFSGKPAQIERSEKKYYVVDTGFTVHASHRSSPDYGFLYENAVALELLRRRALQPDVDFYYYRNSQGYEVDFVIRAAGKTRELIQVSYDISDNRTEGREIRALLHAARELKCDRLTLVTDARDEFREYAWYDLQGKIRVVPLWKWLLESNKTQIKSEPRKN